MSLNWYVTSLLLASSMKSAFIRAQRCRYLIQATDHEEAYQDSLRLGTAVAEGSHQLLGIEDLLLVHEEPGDGSELFWSELEISPAELDDQVREKGAMRAFRLVSDVGWYSASIVLYEMHDEGTHGDRLLVWINTYLISARDPAHAYQRAIQIGAMQQDIPGSHVCGVDKAHWLFKGIRDIIPLQEPPAADSLLWCDELSTKAEDLQAMIPAKPELGVFKWEAERLQQP